MHNACMAISITIRNVPNKTRDELAARAERGGQSLQEYLRGEMIDLADRTDIDVLLLGMRRRKEATQSSLSIDQILDHRDADRG